MARLGDLERSVMDVLWSADDWLTARDVAARLHHERDLAYTTVLTVLERLERKGFVRRQRAARAHRYAATDSRETVVAEAMLEALGTADDRGSALVRFVGSVSAEEAEILRRALEPAGDAATDGTATASGPGGAVSDSGAGSGSEGISAEGVGTEGTGRGPGAPGEAGGPATTTVGGLADVADVTDSTAAATVASMSEESSVTAEPRPVHLPVDER
ncbi:CopY family transcriptional regulator [Parafrankia soli]|uniref:CopY family transcriptional regulator n=1 Tax=Parafrankia soli TaxID=2599596 RepID=A0A1S1RFP0_9ACTN|nr:BlaI/MecI/CopY family transcriptional regulator [Parafrankia soli]OHV45020.1 CopY family transcriptional regulator [Parafrankia soli]